MKPDPKPVKREKHIDCKWCKKPYLQRLYRIHGCCSIDCAVSLSLHKTGKEKLKKDKEAKKRQRTADKEMKIEVYGKENRKYLQDEINKLARKIDAYFNLPCIDQCGRPYGKQIDGAHFHAMGGSKNAIRYHLHNVHSADSQCNNYSNQHLTGYKTGIIERYGEDYWKMLEGLPLKYPSLNLSNRECWEKLQLVRKINRTFHTYQITDPVSAREMFNKLIGIYP